MLDSEWNYDDPCPDDTPILARFEWGESGDVQGEYECYCSFTTGFHRVESGELISTSSGYAAMPVAWRSLPARSCERCRYRGPFIDGGETCPRCKLVQ